MTVIEETAEYNGITYRLRVFQYGSPLIDGDAAMGLSTYGLPRDPPVWGGEYACAVGEDGQPVWLDFWCEESTPEAAMQALKREILVMIEFNKRLFGPQHHGETS